MLKKSIFQTLGGFDPDLTSCQDHDLWMKIANSNNIVKYSSDPLSYFYMGESNRISFDYYNRLKGASLFLDKWKDTIISKNGSRHYNWFKKDYLSKVSLPLFYYSITHYSFQKATLLYFNHLLCYPQFYYSLINKIKKIILTGIKIFPR